MVDTVLRLQGNAASNQNQNADQNQNAGGEKDKAKEQPKKKWEPPVPTRVGKKNVSEGIAKASKLPTVYPTTRCRLKLYKMERIKDYLTLERVSNGRWNTGRDY